MADIFISYAKKDRSRVESLAKALMEQGWSVFWDRAIPGGKTWDEVIEEELDAAKCVVVVWSKISIKSRWVRAEAEEGLHRNILVPVSIEDVKIPLLFRPIQSVRLIHWEGDSNHPQFVKLISDLSPILGLSPKKVKEAEQLRAEEERRRRREQEQRLREEEQKSIEAARKAEDERKQKEAEARRKAEEERKKKEIEEQRKIDEERKRKEKEQEPIEAAQKAEEKQEHKDAGANLKLDSEAPSEPKLTGQIAPEPRRRGKVLKFGAADIVIVLLIAGIWWWVSRQQANEVSKEIDKINRQALELENAVPKVDMLEQIEELSRQRNTLSHQVEGFSEQASKAGMGLKLEELQNRLEQVQIQLTKKDKEFSEVRQEMKEFDSQVLNLEDAVAKLDKPEQLDELYRQRDTLNNQVAALSKQAIMFGMRSQLEQLQNRLERIQIEIANKEKEFIEVRQELKKLDKVARLFVETVPEEATVRILNIKPKFVQGMELEPGSYHVEVAAEKYETERRWIRLVAGQEDPFRFELSKINVIDKISAQKTISNSIGMEFVLIPAGKFVMGSQISPEEVARRYGNKVEFYKDEQPPHTVNIT